MIKSKIKMIDKVRHVLEKFPQSRGCDAMVVGFLYQEFYNIDISKCTVYEMMEKVRNGDLPVFESIRRCRCTIQSKGKYLPLEREVLINRKKMIHKEGAQGKRWW